MKKEYIVGGLAIVGAIALFAYLKPTTTKRNSEGFFGANGRKSLSGKVSSDNCAWCKTSEGTVYHTGGDRNCSGGDRCITRYAYAQKSY